MKVTMVRWQRCSQGWSNGDFRVRHTKSRLGLHFELDCLPKTASGGNAGVRDGRNAGNRTLGGQYLNGEPVDVAE